MKRSSSYHTGLWVTKDSSFPRGPYSGKGWALSFERDKSAFPRIHNGSEVLVHASNWRTAQQATNLIHAALSLVTGDSGREITHQRPFAYREDDPDLKGMRNGLQRNFKEFALFTPDILIACKIAVKVSFNRHASYALTKYYLSCDLYSTPIIDLDPQHSRNLRLSAFYDDHVRFATSIILAYSAIEELDLQVKATESTPSRLPTGEWNPIVKEDLLRRLQKHRIDLSDSLLWSQRGPTRRIDKKRPPKARSKPPWARGQVKDVETDICDAISDASWLRSKVSAHGFTQLASSLSPYDVANVQHLARRLLLESLGFWRYYE